MKSVEGWTTIRYLSAQGKSIRAIAKELGFARNTVRAALRDETPPRYVRPQRANAQLAPFAAQIQQMLDQQHFIGSRILRELRAAGYTGGPTALYAYLRSLKAAIPDSRITERFETPPAQQGQFDWSPYMVTIGDTAIKAIVYGMVLGFSRRKFYWPSRDETQGSIFEALEVTLRHFGGAPKELLVDNARAFVTDASPARFAWNTHFLELCGHYAIQPVACQPYRAQTKGKVERPFFYLEEHFIKGRSWESFDALTQDLAAFATDELDQRIHGTTRERPLLTPLPRQPFVSTCEEMRKASWDCLISFGGSRYSVPWVYAGKHVWLRASQGAHLVVRNQKGEGVARHQLAETKGMTRIDPAHYVGFRQGSPRTKGRVDAAFLHQFPEHQWFVDAAHIQHKANGTDHLRGILGLAELYASEAVITALGVARDYNTYSHRFIRGLLEAGDVTTSPRPARPVVPVDTRFAADLGIYQLILEESR